MDPNSENSPIETQPTPIRVQVPVQKKSLVNTVLHSKQGVIVMVIVALFLLFQLGTIIFEAQTAVNENNKLNIQEPIR